MRIYQTLSTLLLTLFLFTIALPCLANEEKETPQVKAGEAPQKFTTIRLAPEGVVAIDENGNRWIYDFDSAAFISDQKANQENGGTEGAEAGTPVETRAVDEKTVEPLAQTVVVGPTEYVAGDIIAYGRVTIRGWAKGNVQSITSRVLVTESGRVDGDITAPEILIKPGGVVMGKVNETGVSLNLKGIQQAFDFSGIIIVLAFTISLMVACFVIMTLMPRQVNVLDRCIRTYRTRSFLLGFLSLFLLPIGVVLLCITIVGILATPLVPLLIVFIFFATVTGFARTLGERALAIVLRNRPIGTHLATQVGILLFMSLWLVTAILLGAADETSQGFGVFFLVISILLNSYVLLTGLGAAILTRVGTREYLSWHERHMAAESHVPMPAPPPIPDIPTTPSDGTSNPPPDRPLL